MCFSQTFIRLHIDISNSDNYLNMGDILNKRDFIILKNCNSYFRIYFYDYNPVSH